QALHEGRAVGVLRDPFVGVDVVDGHVLRMFHDPAAHAGAHGEPPSLPEWRDGVFVGVVALVTVAQDEGGAVRVHQLPCGRAHDLHDGRDVAGERQLLHGVDEQLRRRVACRPAGGLTRARTGCHGRYVLELTVWLVKLLTARRNHLEDSLYLLV